MTLITCKMLESVFGGKKLSAALKHMSSMHNLKRSELY
jgi:hypothetical protein